MANENETTTPFGEPPPEVPPPEERHPSPQARISMGDAVLSPTLKDHVPQGQWPNPAIVCMTCPHAVWQKTGDALLCYCRVMYRVSWSKAQPTEIVACDGASLGTES